MNINPIALIAAKQTREKKTKFTQAIKLHELKLPNTILIIKLSL